MRPALALSASVLLVLAGCGALLGPAEPTPTLTPAAVPADGTPGGEPPATREPTGTSIRETPLPAPVLLENVRDREYTVTLSVVEGPMMAVEVVYDDGRSTVVDPSANATVLAERLSAGEVVDVRVVGGAEAAQYRVAANASLTRRPFAALSRASSSASVLWVVVPAGEERVVAAGVDTCAPPHSLVTEFRVRVVVRADRITADCA